MTLEVYCFACKLYKSLGLMKSAWKLFVNGILQPTAMFAIILCNL